MRGTFLLFLLTGLFTSMSAQAQLGTSNLTGEIASLRDCRPPADAKEAQVLAFDKGSLEAKLAVTLDKGEFKVVTVKIWDRPQDPRPLIPIIEAARITQGRLHIYTPNLNADPDPVHDKQVLLAASLGGAHVCWATEGALLKQGSVDADLRARTR
jgi:hypothetical protein